MKYLLLIGLASFFFSCNNNQSFDNEGVATANSDTELVGGELDEADIQRLSNRNQQYTLNDEDIVASVEGIQGSLDELTRKANQFEVDLQRMEQVSAGTASINLSQAARQKLLIAQKELIRVHTRLDEARKAQASQDFVTAGNIIRQANQQISHAENLYAAALADDSSIATQ